MQWKRYLISREWVSSGEARALDDGDAGHAAMGPLWVAFLLGGCHGPPSRFGSPNITRSRGLLGFVPGLSRSYDVAHRNPRIKTGRTLTKIAVDSALGRDGVSHLAGEFRANVDSLAYVDYQLRNGQFVATRMLLFEFFQQKRFLDHELAAADKSFSASSRYRSPYTSHLLAAPTETPAAMLVCSRRSCAVHANSLVAA